MHRLIPFPLLLLTALYATQAPAALVVSNLGHSRLFDVTVSDSLWHAVAFVSGADVTLDSADLLMGTSAGGGNFGVEVWSSNGRPDALLSSLTGPSDPAAGVQNYVGSVALQAATEYWLVAAIRSGSAQYGWGVTLTSGASSAEPGWSIPVNAYTSSSNGGSSWQPPTLGPTMFAVNASSAVVPVPGTLALLLSGIGIAAARRGRQRMQAA